MEFLDLEQRVARAAGQAELAQTALKRAFAEVQKKAGRLRDASWRERYLKAMPARWIVEEAQKSGITDAA